MKTNNRLSILYAEANQDACTMLETLLRFSEISVLSEHTAKNAFRKAQDNCFDLYLLDSRFTDWSGLELCRRLHKLNPQIPIVFYSADGYESDCQKGLAAGAKAYLVKPASDKVAPTIFGLVANVTENV